MYMHISSSQYVCIYNMVYWSGYIITTSVRRHWNYGKLIREYTGCMG